MHFQIKLPFTMPSPSHPTLGKEKLSNAQGRGKIGLKLTKSQDGGASKEPKPLPKVDLLVPLTHQMDSSS